MMKGKIWLSSPHMGGSELNYINEAFIENWVAPLGPNVNGLEEDISQFVGEQKHIAALGSGTSALHLALIINGVLEGDEVLCQSMTFSATANPIRYVGATPVFIDSERETWNLCPETLERAIRDRVIQGKKPKAIIVVHLYGMPAKMTEILSVAKKYDIAVIEDAAEALGSAYKGQKCGTFGEMAILSFNGNKIITTSGGGALVCSNPEQKEKAVFLSTQARDVAPHYQHSEIGYNYRMSNICAGIGRGQMEVLESRVEARRANHFFYVDLFKVFKGVEVLSEPSEDFYSNHWLSAIVINEEIAGFNRENLRLALEVENIESRPLWKPMHLQPVFAEYPFYGTGVSEDLFNRGLCLPSGSNLSDEDRERIKSIILKFKR